MIWKRKGSNLIVAIILSIAYVIVTFLNVIGPFHINAVGNINIPGMLPFYSIIYLLISLLITWSLYFYLKEKPEILFFLLMILGILIIFIEIFIWGSVGSTYHQY